MSASCAIFQKPVFHWSTFLRVPSGARPIHIASALFIVSMLWATNPPGALRSIGITRNTRINQAIEAIVRSQPGQYLWGYARYKTPRKDAP